MSALKRLGIKPPPAGAAAGDAASEAQRQTGRAFDYKWARRDAYESPAVKQHMKSWLLQRYCDGDPGVLDGWLAGGPKIILDAGCGVGYSALLLFGDRLRDHDYLGVDISGAVEIARQRFAEQGVPGDFLQASLTDMPVPDGSVEIVFSEGVLHHTDSTEQSLRRLAAKLRPGGRFLFYVYARKGPIREFTDDHVRGRLRPMTDAEAWEALMPLTKLGAALGELNATIDVPEDVPLLGIRKGPVDVQRLFYWNVCKAFYRPGWTLEEMNVTNFDWYRPLNCHRHTPEEVRRYCAAAGLSIERMDVQPAGITVVAKKD